jgi:mono/diheme cytochrome c family protein
MRSSRAWTPARSAARLALAFTSLPALALAQRGDVEGEAQPPLSASIVVPPAPVLTPEQELATFTVPDGYEIQLVASEPLVRDPVCIAFAADGSFAICGMHPYMCDIDGKYEDAPLGSVVLVRDSQRYEIASGLPLPRALAPCRGGWLVIAPPQLVWFADEDEDGVFERREVWDRGLGGIESPEHAINGLVPAPDGRFVCANVPWDYAFENDKLIRVGANARGQWGISLDASGRQYFNSNEDPLRMAAIPPRYAVRNPALGTALGADLRILEDKSVESARVNTGVNRAYREGVLRADGRLARYTAACSPLYVPRERLELLGDGAQDSVFICEPAGNCVARVELAEDELGRMQAKPARRADGREFLTSTDERFRPVSLSLGPDGALYVVDMYRGVIQHKLFVTSFLRKQVESRGLAQPTGLGRIWRVRRKDAPRAAVPAIAPRALDAELDAIRAGEFAATTDDKVLASWRAAAARSPRLRWQVLLSAGELPTARACALLDELLRADCARREWREAAVSGLAGEELALLARIVPAPEWRDEREGRPALFELLARCAAKPAREADLATLAAFERDAAIEWQRAALERGRVAARRPGAEAPMRALDARERELYEAGAKHYAAICAACHQPSGLGAPGKAPPLLDSPYVLGPPERLAALISAGLNGPIQVGNDTWNAEMPAWKASDDELHALLVYLRREWGHRGEPPSRGEIERGRARAAQRGKPWTASEL